MAVALLVRRVGQLHEDPAVVARWRTWMGPLLAWLTPRRRRSLLALAALYMAVRQPLREMFPAVDLRSPNGPEAGVWVIAETRDLPTRFMRSVVTDDQGRYVLPDLPKAKYQIWVRGYGLVDSPKVESEPGKHLDLTAVPAPDDRAAAEYYPAIYWYSMLKIPAADQFGGSSDIPANVQMRWIEDDGRVTTFRNPSGNSNGNTFDYWGRQLSCEHGGRRVVRYEPNGQVTVVAATFQNKRLNSPNDVVVHPDGDIWFTDPPYGIAGNYEGFKSDPELPVAVYRVDGR